MTWEGTSFDLWLLRATYGSRNEEAGLWVVIWQGRLCEQLHCGSDLLSCAKDMEKMAHRHLKSVQNRWAENKYDSMYIYVGKFNNDFSYSTKSAKGRDSNLNSPFSKHIVTVFCFCGSVRFLGIQRSTVSDCLFQMSEETDTFGCHGLANQMCMHVGIPSCCPVHTLTVSLCESGGV